MIEHEIQTIDDLGPESLPAAVDALRLDRWRLVQILCISFPEGYELTYSFGGGYALHNLRLTIGLKDPVPSITPFYEAAYLYENEIRDLFGVRIERISPDWEGKVYDVATEKPFAKATIAATSSEAPPSPIRARPLAGGTP
jgi:ech hydrogenase subunit D